MLKHSDLTDERIRATLPRIAKLIYPEAREIEIAAWHVHGEPVPVTKALKAKYAPFAVGEAWGGHWDTTWFRFRGEIPREWKGREVVARVAVTNGGNEGFTGEGLIYVNGEVVRAINVNRDEVALTEKARGGEKFEFYIEAAANGGSDLGGNTESLNLPDYHGRLRFDLNRAEVTYADREAQAYYFDFKVAMEAMDALPAGQRRAELQTALNKSVNLFDHRDPETIRPARAALRDVLSRKNGGTVHTVSAVGHAHIDTAWLWPLRETIRKCARTFSTALDYMEKYPEYVFVCSQAQQYAWMKAYYPDIFARIKKAIRRGQWEPVGSMWIETDCNLVSGESLVRQILHGKNFFEKELGVETKDVWIPDVFGYAASMPQIMKKSGVDYFLTQKISWSQFNKFPHHTFLWEGIDGTQIFSHFPPADTYNADTGAKHLMDSVQNFKDHGRATRSLLVYGYGDGGGGPSIEMLEKARRLRDFDGLPKLELEKALKFFQKAEADAKDLPVWVGELYLELHRGTYTSQARNKRGNRKSEFLLRDAEFLDAVSFLLAPNRKESAANPPRAVYDVTGLDHEETAHTHHDALDRAWKLLLLNQFHDIIPGSSIHWVYQDSERDYETIGKLGESVKDSALDTLAKQIDTTAFKKPLLVVNTLGFRRREVVELPDGSVASVDVPPLGYEVVDRSDEYLRTSEQPVKVASSKQGITLDNGLLRVKINSRGHISSVTDLRFRREVLAAQGNEFHLHQDIPNRWDAWDVDVFYKETKTVIEGLESLKVVEEGPLRAAVEIVRTFGKSRITQKVVLRSGSARIDFPTEVDWKEDQKMLKVAFPVEIHSPKASYEIQYGHLERPTHTNTSWDMGKFEVAAQKWADLSESGYGVALLNDCKYGYDIQDNVMRLSLLRAPMSPDPAADRCVHHFTYALLPHAGDFQSAGVIDEAYSLNVPLFTRELSVHEGVLASAHSFLRTDAPNAVIESVKVSEDGEAIIVRLYEAHGARGSTTLSTSLPIRKVVLTDLLEREIRSLPLKSGGIKVDLTPFEIVTLKLIP